MRTRLLFLINLLTLSVLSAQVSPTVDSVRVAEASVVRYGKFTAEVYVTARFTNPYDYDQVGVEATFTGPDGQELRVDGYYYQPYTLDDQTGSLTADGTDGRFAVRFSPPAAGRWTYVIRVSDADGSSASHTGSLICTENGDPLNHGYVRRNETNHLNFDDGRQYIPIGENIAWPAGNPVQDYRKWIDGVTDNGGNFLRLWNAYWGLGLEWKAGYDGYGGLRNYKQTNARYQDWLYDYAAERGLYVMLCLQYHGQVSTRVNPAWNDSPYNAANGGPLRQTREFFTDSTAMAHTKNRLRYVVARWGYSRNIMAWELFNEVGWTDDYEEIKDDVAAWHATMARYLKEIDPYGHLVTTSFADESHGAETWTNPDIDFTQNHFYVNSGNIERALVGGMRRYLSEYGTPTLVGEFGLGADRDLSAADPDGLHVHNSLWAGLFGGGLGTAMSWWWDNYVHPLNLYRHFRGIAGVTADIPFFKGDMAPMPAYVRGAPGDVVLTPTLGWASVADDTIRIRPDEQITPRLSYFLYGSDYNTQFRAPPTFVADFPGAATFTVTTGDETGTAPGLVVFLDGVEVLRAAAVTNQEYSVAVPAGLHRITVDNPGVDWISINSYTLGEAGSRVDAYVLSTIDGLTAAGWVFNHQYNHEFLAENGGPPEPVVGSQVVLSGMPAGSYWVNWYDCMTGQERASAPAVADGRGLVFDVPDFDWDLAFRISAAPTTALRPPVLSGPYSLGLYPNPARPADVVRLDLPLPARATVQVFDLTGGLRAYFDEVIGANGIRLPDDLAAGIYWVSVQQGGIRVTGPLRVGR